MISVNIILDKRTPLFKKLKKENVLNVLDGISIKLENKPSIGEAICLHAYSVSEEENKTLYDYLNKRNIPLILRITDLCTSVYFFKSEKEYFEVLQMKCDYENYKNWKL